MEQIIQDAIKEIVCDFKKCPQKYFTEEDIRWRLMSQIKQLLHNSGEDEIPILNGQTSIIHGEYPTPYRCNMKDKSFELKNPEEKGFHRGHFDIVILEPKSIRDYNFEIIRAQDYGKFLPLLPNLPMPFVDTIIELMLLRDLNKTGPIAIELGKSAVQDILKTKATLVPQNGYYCEPFARRGIVLLMDNSELITNKNIDTARKKFRDELNKSVKWRELPNSLKVIYVASGKECILHETGTS